MCRGKGYDFQAIYSGIGSSNSRKLVWNKVPFNGIANCNSKRMKGSSGIGSLKFAKFTLVEGSIFVNPAAHPHPNYIGVPPPPKTRPRVFQILNYFPDTFHS